MDPRRFLENKAVSQYKEDYLKVLQQFSANNSAAITCQEWGLLQNYHSWYHNKILVRSFQW